MRQLDGHKFGQTSGDSEGQRSLVCCSAWGLKDFHMTEQLNNNKYVISNKSKWIMIKNLSILGILSQHLLEIIYSNSHFQKTFPLISVMLSPGFMWFSSVQFSRSVVSDSLQPHESQHARPPCPSPFPGVYSDSRPSTGTSPLYKENTDFNSLIKLTLIPILSTRKKNCLLHF